MSSKTSLQCRFWLGVVSAFAIVTDAGAVQEGFVAQGAGLKP